MKTLKKFKEHNRYVGLPEPKNEDIDIGRYDDHELRLTGDPVQIQQHLVMKGVLEIRIKSRFMPFLLV